MNDSLSSESFFHGAREAAHKAMEDHGRPEHDEFALHAGVAVEKLAKAVLVSKNPVYIGEIRSNSADMVLYLGGHLQADEEKVRTVGAMEAIKRLRKINVLQPDPQLDLLIEMRNGAAHTAADSTLAKGMISPLARTSRHCSVISASRWTPSGNGGRTRSRPPSTNRRTRSSATSSSGSPRPDTPSKTGSSAFRRRSRRALSRRPSPATRSGSSGRRST
ncbi:hypothetical protein ACWCPF_44695 [Streptomyces sp. NPDC001858]